MQLRARRNDVRKDSGGDGYEEVEFTLYAFDPMPNQPEAAVPRARGCRPVPARLDGGLPRPPRSSQSRDRRGARVDGGGCARVAGHGWREHSPDWAGVTGGE